MMFTMIGLRENNMSIIFYLQCTNSDINEIQVGGKYIVTMKYSYGNKIGIFQFNISVCNMIGNDKEELMVFYDFKRNAFGLMTDSWQDRIIVQKLFSDYLKNLGVLK